MNDRWLVAGAVVGVGVLLHAGEWLERVGAGPDVFGLSAADVDWASKAGATVLIIAACLDILLRHAAPHQEREPERETVCS
jgi:hypothetical protein